MNKAEEKKLVKAFKTINELLPTLKEGDTVGLNITDKKTGAPDVLNMNCYSSITNVTVNKRAEIVHNLSVEVAPEAPNAPNAPQEPKEKEPVPPVQPVDGPAF